MNTIFILGSPDAEMTAIISLLELCEVEYYFAAIIDGSGNPQRTSNGQAYQFTSIVNPTFDIVTPVENLRDKMVYLVECNPIFPFDSSIIVESIDHHMEKGETTEVSSDYNESSLVVVTMTLNHLLVGNNLYKLRNYLKENKERLNLIAACDHHLANAYNGLYGFTKAQVFQHRVSERAAFRKVDNSAVYSDFRKAVDKITRALEFSKKYKDIDVLPPISDMPDASCFLGIPYITCNYNKKLKIIIGGNTKPEQVQSFLNDFRKLQATNPAILKVYGVPNRGYAGVELEGDSHRLVVPSGVFVVEKNNIMFIPADES